MQEGSEGNDAHAPGDFARARAVDTTRSNHDVRDSTIFTIFFDDLLLLDLCEAIGFPAEFRTLFDGA